jgi:CRISPR-associated endonuclease Csn1
MPKGKGQLPTKKGMDIKKYGGYNKISGAYFCVVEHTIKNKRVRSILPVYTYKVKEYEKNPLEYCVKTLELSDPVIIVNKILNNTLLELNENKVMITGRTGKQVIFKHSYEFAIDNVHATYLKNLSKYVDRCSIEKKELPMKYISGISKEQNENLYDWYIERLTMPVYQNIFSNIQKDLRDNRDKFFKLDDLSQSKLLLEVLKAFKCDRQCPDFKALNGKGKVGEIKYNSAISSMNSANIINQSVTGIFEVRQDLLEGYTK